MSKRIRKLTPNVLKRIIREEKQKIIKESKRKRTPKGGASDVKELIRLKKKQALLVLEFKKLFKKRQLLKKKLVKRL
tara:strand:+ start:1465 stop:1695 length:231 start_codon:yes stop_codon:yes gene_type:complete